MPDRVVLPVKQILTAGIPDADVGQGPLDCANLAHNPLSQREPPMGASCEITLTHACRIATGHLNAYSQTALTVRLPEEEQGAERPLNLFEATEYKTKRHRRDGEQYT